MRYDGRQRWHWHDGGVWHTQPTQILFQPRTPLKAVEAYLADLGNDDLEVAEIMVFDNNSYAIVVEESTGIGAFELLVDPATKAVYPEYGPNMMWNLKYGMHAGSGFGGGMMGGYGDNDSGECPKSQLR